MAEQEEISDPRTESLTDQISDKIHGGGGGGGGGNSSSTSSDSEYEAKKTTTESPVKEKIFRLFGREKPVHKVFGGGKPADIFLWRNKKISASVLGTATAIWVLFELLEYHLLTLEASRIPEVRLPEESFVDVASAIRIEINRAFAVLREIISGKDLKKFLGVVAGLWFLSIVGSCCSFLTLSYMLFVLLHTVPVLYEKYDDEIDAYAEKALHEIKKQYAAIDSKVLSKIPRGPLDKKRA